MNKFMNHLIHLLMFLGRKMYLFRIFNKSITNDKNNSVSLEIHNENR